MYAFWSPVNKKSVWVSSCFGIPGTVLWWDETKWRLIKITKQEQEKHKKREVFASWLLFTNSHCTWSEVQVRPNKRKPIERQCDLWMKHNITMKRATQPQKKWKSIGKRKKTYNPTVWLERNRSRMTEGDWVNRTVRVTNRHFQRIFHINNSVRIVNVMNLKNWKAITNNINNESRSIKRVNSSA